jgi:hypothetical protein
MRDLNKNFPEGKLKTQMMKKNIPSKWDSVKINILKENCNGADEFI